MLWAIPCAGNSDTAAIREPVLVSHREYLGSRKDIRLPAGATQNDEGAETICSLFIVIVNGRAEVKAFSDGDPFTQKGVFRSITITRMRRGQWNPGAAEVA